MKKMASSINLNGEDDPTWVGGAGAGKAPLPRKSVAARRNELREKDQRVQTLTCVAVTLGIVEGVSSTMTSALYLFNPLNPRVSCQSTHGARAHIRPYPKPSALNP